MDQIERPWSPQEDEMLIDLKEKHGLNWSLISKYVPGKSTSSCWSRWLSLQRSFTPEEDEMLQNLVQIHGLNWSPISMSILDRSAKTCWSRWFSLQGSFTPEEDEMLLNLVVKHGPNWSLISKSIPPKSGKSCSSRWLSLQTSFTLEEDKMLQNLVETHGRNWSLISKSIPGKSATSCRVRWLSSPQVMPFTPEDDQAILLAHTRYGERWDGIAELLGRPYDVIENDWNSTLKWKSRSKTNDEDITIGDHDIYIPPPSFSDIGGSSYIHDGNLSHDVGGVGKSAPSISYMARVNMSSGGTHSYSRDKSAPSISYMERGNMSLGGRRSFSRDKTAPSWNVLKTRYLSPMMNKSDSVKEFLSGEFEPMMIKSDNVQEIPSDEFTWNILFGEDGDN